MFLEKYASARARGAALYNDFLCKSFVADNQRSSTPSTEPNLMIRPGCKTCHATLEPLAAYFARVEPASFVFLPEASFPAHSTTCKLDKNGKLNGPCNALYDPAFADDKGRRSGARTGRPRTPTRRRRGPRRTSRGCPEFAACAVQRVTSSFLGRPTTADDEPLLRVARRRVRAVRLPDAGARPRARSFGRRTGRSNNLSSERGHPWPRAGTARGT